MREPEPFVATAPGTFVGPYRILSAIGRGGMGIVYRARDPQLPRDVALKILPDERSLDPIQLTRFENEARLAASLNHPNTITIYAVGQDGPTRYIAMELVEGETLSDLLADGPLPLDRALAIATQVADGLAKAHAAGIIHRDLSARNVMVTTDGVAKILDFGLSKLASKPVAPDAPTQTMTARLTGAGTVVGTAEWMSPEQARGQPLLPQSDQFAFGSLLYAMLTGRPPFHRDTAVQTLSNIIEGSPTPLQAFRTDVPAAVEAVLERCHRKDPLQRYPVTRDLAAAMHELSAGSVPPVMVRGRRRNWRVAVAVAALALSLVGARYGWSRPFEPVPEAAEWYGKGRLALHSMTFDAARRALEQAVRVDPGYALAYASLARAYDELDYADRAKDTMLRAMTVAQETRLVDADVTRLRAQQAVVSRDFDVAARLFAELEAAATGHERAEAALETGWLAQQRDDTEKAAAAYSRALDTDQMHAAAWLRLGFIQSRRADDAKALDSFSRAERIYLAASDFEGVTETLYQRANLLNRRSRAAEALPLIERALAAAGSLDNEYQMLRLQLLQGAALRNSSNTERGLAVTRAAVDRAVDRGMDNLATSGLITLGNTYLARLDLDAAETLLRRALAVAERGRVRRYEALASLSIASLLEQRNRPTDARPFAVRAHTFYQAAGFRREAVQALTVLGGLQQQLGMYDEAAATLKAGLTEAAALKDPQVELRLRERFVQLLQAQGAWPAALREVDASAPSPGTRQSAWFLRVTRAGLLWRTGRAREARTELTRLEESMRTGDATGLPAVHVEQAALAYAHDECGESVRRAATAVKEANTSSDITRQARLLIALCTVRQSRGAKGVESVQALIQEFDGAHLPAASAETALALAQGLAATPQRRQVPALAERALDFFESRRMQEAIWRAHAVAALTSDDQGEADRHRTAARDALAALREQWGAEIVSAYTSIPGLSQLAARLP